MSGEERIIQELGAKFNYAASVQIIRPRRISLEVSYNNFREVFDYCVKGLGFIHLCTITGLDEGENLSLIYHLAADSGILFNLKTAVPKENPVINTVIEYFPGAEIYERELADLLGVKIEGLPAGNRYPLTDGWPQGAYPLRKDWKYEQSNISQEDHNA